MLEDMLKELPDLEIIHPDDEIPSGNVLIYAEDESGKDAKRFLSIAYCIDDSLIIAFSTYRKDVIEKKVEEIRRKRNRQVTAVGVGHTTGEFFMDGHEDAGTFGGDIWFVGSWETQNLALVNIRKAAIVYWGIYLRAYELDKAREGEERQ